MIGNMKESITAADSCLETIMCPFVRSCLDIALKQQYSFLDGLIIPHTCDNIERSYDMWRYYLKFPFLHMINVPHMVHPASFDFMAQEIRLLIKKLEEFTGEEISEQALWKAIRLHNRIRAMVGELYQLRRETPPLISGADAMRVMLAGTAILPEEFDELLRQVMEEIRHGNRPPVPRGPRLMLYGAEVDDVSFIEMVEDIGANVVIDDLNTGTRSYFYPVSEDGSPEMVLAQTYLGAQPCPRTFREGSPRERFQYLLDFARDFHVDGVILYVTRFCDTHEYDAPDVKRVLQEEGYPVLHLEVDYSIAAMEQLRTRVQAFIEMLG